MNHFAWMWFFCATAGWTAAFAVASYNDSTWQQAANEIFWAACGGESIGEAERDGYVTYSCYLPKKKMVVTLPEQVRP